MTAIVVFTPTASAAVDTLCAGNINFCGDSPLITFSLNARKRVRPVEPWDLAICWEPDRRNYDADHCKKLEKKFKLAKTGLDKRQNKDNVAELVILQHNGGGSCHQFQTELVKKFFPGCPKALAMYSREEDGNPNFQHLCQMANALREDNCIALANDLLRYFRAGKLARLRNQINELQMWESFIELRCWGTNLMGREKIPPALIEIDAEEDFKARACDLQNDVVSLTSSIRDQSGSWA